MTFEIKEQNEKMVVNVNGRLDTPANLSRHSRKSFPCLKMPTKKSCLTATIWSTSVVLVSVFSSLFARKQQPRAER